MKEALITKLKSKKTRSNIFWAILFLIFGIAMYQGNKEGNKPNGPALDEEAARKMQNKLLGID